MLKLLLPVVALLGVGGSAVGASAYLLTRGDTVDEIPRVVPVQVSPTAIPSSPVIETPTTEPGAKGGQPPQGETPLPTLQTYRNERYGYTLIFPEGWRVASSFMERFAETITDPGRTIVPDDYALLAALSEQEERKAVEQASQEVTIGLSPWFGFAEGRSIHIFPMEIIYPGVNVDTFLMDVDTAGVIRTNLDIRQEALDSGKSVTRLTRREVDDNGDFTYDLVIVRTGTTAGEGIIIRIVKTPDYEKEVFETIFRSFKDG